MLYVEAAIAAEKQRLIEHCPEFLLFIKRHFDPDTLFLSLERRKYFCTYF
jgi:predicted lipid carrier protein YhbT